MYTYIPISAQYKPLIIIASLKGPAPCGRQICRSKSVNLGCKRTREPLEDWPKPIFFGQKLLKSYRKYDRITTMFF